MIRNYFHIILRNLFKYKLFSFINISGLALAIACSILVVLYIQNEISYDTVFSNSDRIYRLYTHAKSGEREATLVNTPFIMGKQLKENYPEIEAYTILTDFEDRVRAGDKNLSEKVFVASPDFFRIFDYTVLHGTTSGILDDPASLVITKDIAIKYFGNEDVIGESMRIEIGDEQKEFIIRAVLENMPSNTSIRFSMMISDNHLKDLFPEPMLTSWHMITGENYVLLDKNAVPAELPDKFQSLIRQEMAEDLERVAFHIYLQPVTDIHLNTDLPSGNVPVSDPKYIVILTAIAVLILLIASINFVMLSLGRSFMRAREIGIRKSTGATRQQLMVQFLSESVAIAFAGLIIGIGIVYLVLPWFNELSGQFLEFNISPENLLIYIGLTIFTGLLAGFYPALIMSGFKPVKILKGDIRYGKKNSLFGTALITGQFILFIFLIGCTLIMKKQLNYLQQKNLGFDKENVVAVPVPAGDAKGVREVVKVGFSNARILDNEIRKLPEAGTTGVASHTFEPGSWTEIGYEDQDGRTKSFFYNTVDASFIPAMGIHIVAGRNFQSGNISDEKRSVIVNRAFAEEFGMTNAVGERIPHDEFEDHEIIGVVENFHIQSLHEKIRPLMLAMNIDMAFSGANNINIGSSVQPKLFVRLKAGQIEAGLSGIEKAWDRIYPGETFEYEFVDQTLKEQYEKEINLNKVVTSSSVLAVVIGCLGLFGISLLSFNNRIREISIRKVLGAPPFHILFILSRRFVFLILVALLFSIPVILQVMQRWLSEFEYRTTIGIGVFLVAGLLSLLVILITLSYQGISALRTNPADNLRNE
jgi:putative ABC transport system permease protein